MLQQEEPEPGAEPQEPGARYTPVPVEKEPAALGSGEPSGFQPEPGDNLVFVPVPELLVQPELVLEPQELPEPVQEPVSLVPAERSGEEPEALPGEPQPPAEGPV